MFKNPFSKKKKILPVPSESNNDKLSADAHAQEMSQEESSYPLFVAVYEFVSTADDELDFKKGELLYIIDTSDDWWFAKAKHSGQEGYVPSIYVTECDPLEAEE